MRLLLALALIIITVPCVIGQTVGEEITRLQQHLGVSAETKITPQPGAGLPKGTAPIRVYIATGLDLKVHENYARWAEKWNKSGDSRKFGKVELVSDIAHADIVLARYTLTDQARTESGSYVTPGTVWNPATNTHVTRPVARTYSYGTVPVYAYVLRKSGDEYLIVHRYSDTTSVGEWRGAGEALWEGFEKLMKRR